MQTRHILYAYCVRVDMIDGKAQQRISENVKIRTYRYDMSTNSITLTHTHTHLHDLNELYGVCVFVTMKPNENTLQKGMDRRLLNVNGSCSFLFDICSYSLTRYGKQSTFKIQC